MGVVYYIRAMLMGVVLRRREWILLRVILLIDGRDFVIFDLSFESFVIREKIDCIGVVIDI